MQKDMHKRQLIGKEHNTKHFSYDINGAHSYKDLIIKSLYFKKMQLTYLTYPLKKLFTIYKFF